jgi:molybdate transport system ATP-binding protein
MSLDVREVVLPLSDFSLSVSMSAGRHASALYGPSGSGKTSLLDTIAGLRRPEGGSIALNGRVLNADGTFVPPRARRIGYVPQEDSLFPHLTVRQNVEYGGTAIDGPTADVLEIGGLLDRKPATLSGGERKRVALARALLPRPELLLLDEPLAGIDLALRGRVLDHLSRVLATFTVTTLYVTHELEEAERLCETVFVMERGRIVQRRELRTI